MTRRSRMVLLALRLQRRGKISAARLDSVSALFDARPLPFPTELAELVREYEALTASLKEMRKDRRAFGLSDWRAACMEACAQNAGDARDAIAAYCKRFNVADPIEARYA